VTDDMSALARRAWTVFEPVHAIVYFAPETRAAYEAAGLRGGWMGYFASRSAPMGAVTSPVVVATFHNFQPALVQRAIPDAWRLSTPERVLEARLSVVDRALRRLWGGDVESDDVREAASLAKRVTELLEGGGRPLYAAHAALEAPEAPHLALWHACTLLREHRFDGHVAALTGYDLDGLEALVTATTASGLDPARLRQFRGWTEDEWHGAEDRLRSRNVLVGGGNLTEHGHELRRAVERITDRLAAKVWERAGTETTHRLLSLLHPLAMRLGGEQGIVYPNPIGVPEPQPA